MPAKLVVVDGHERVMCLRCRIIIGDYPMMDGELTCPKCESTYRVVMLSDD